MLLLTVAFMRVLKGLGLEFRIICSFLIGNWCNDFSRVFISFWDKDPYEVLGINMSYMKAFSKINKRPGTFILELRVLIFGK